MIFNVAQLMKSSVGASLTSEIEESQITLDEAIKLVGPLTGHVRVRRVNQGLLVDGWVELTLELTCTRCLKQFEQNLHVTFEERYYPTVDILTGAPLPSTDEDDVFPINEHHEIDLTEAVRQSVLLALPMAPLCQEDCAGLCPQCGRDLNTGPCECKPEVDTRLNVLKNLLENSSQA
jgi:uncharacterized protein